MIKPHIQNKPKVSEFVRNVNLRRMYAGLFSLQGMCKDPITDASTTIDEVLYGEHGAWRGSHPSDDPQ
jgi:hypothetical protein